ncbi:RNA polymerase II elongation factor Ell-like [Bactrocera neohumeralis]|uniref:RNA polymerase II elongation factor Ell-like n=1 Tax=Bactrocera neohumeralis TaxID=98809 RepID=UPI00216573DC|nr:RNA polymerase II elongation factor Ell-like [Bactrocera neohumeralis]
MASQNVANHLKRLYNGRQQTRKIHPISASWNVNQSNISRSNGTELFLKEKPQTGANTKPEVKTEIKNGKLPHISTRKLRERLVHLLAVNSYTRQEINSVFQKEGLRPCERPTLVYVLKAVAQLSRNVYSLRPNIWKEVDENWPYYNEKELQQLKRCKEQSLRGPNSSIELTSESNESQSLKRHQEQSFRAPNSSIELTPESNESQSLKRHKEQSLRAPNSSIELTPESNERHKEQSFRAPNSSIELTPESNESQSLKRHKEQSLGAPNSSIELTPESNESQSLKRHKEQSLRAPNSSIELTPESNESQSLKRHKKQSFRAPNSTIELTPESNESQSSTNSTILPHPVENNSLKRENTSKRANLDNVEPQPTKKRRIESVQSTSDNHTTSQPAKTKASTSSNSNTIEPPKYDFGDYTEITNFEQRQRYATAFDRYHEEYMPLFQQTTELRSSFRELGAQILNMSEDCPEYENISERIATTFLTLNSEDQLRREERVRYLHAKLAHIKRLITLFDSKHTKEIAMAFATAMAKKYELRQDRFEAITDIEEVVGTSKPITRWHKDGATATTHDGLPPTKQEYISDILAEDLALSESDSDDD